MYVHFCGPKNPIVNVEKDVPYFPISERQKTLIKGERITNEEAIQLMSQRVYLSAGKTLKLAV